MRNARHGKRKGSFLCEDGLQLASNSTTASGGSYASNTAPTLPSHQPGAADSEDPHAPSGGGPWQGYETQSVHQAQLAQQIRASDEQLVEALQRDTHSRDTFQRGGQPAQDDQLSTVPVLAVDGRSLSKTTFPKRKRVFSNRTKTGCLTCRKRKKKCDEQHPVCEFVWNELTESSHGFLGMKSIPDSW